MLHKLFYTFMNYDYKEWKFDNKYLQCFKVKTICIQGSKCQSFGFYRNNASPLFVLVHSFPSQKYYTHHCAESLVNERSRKHLKKHLLQNEVSLGQSVDYLHKRERERDRERKRDRERVRESEREWERERERERESESEREIDRDRERESER